MLNQIGDAPNAFARMVREGDVDVVTGDWLSEMNIAWNATVKAQESGLGYQNGFLEQLSDCIEDVAANQIKVVTNAGALNPRALTKRVSALYESRDLSRMTVAMVIGDDVTHLLKQNGERELNFSRLDDENVTINGGCSNLNSCCAVAYIGAWGIFEAPSAGADAVICGRVTDASLVIGAAAWW